MKLTGLTDVQEELEWGQWRERGLPGERGRLAERLAVWLEGGRLVGE